MNAPLRSRTTLDCAAEAIDRCGAGDDLKCQRLRPKSVTEIMQQPIPRDLIAKIVPQVGLGVLYGPPASGKTFLSLNLALSVAQGERWFGHRTRQCGVVYVAAEGRLTTRLMACERYQQQSLVLTAQRLRVIDSSVNLLDPRADLVVLLEELAAAAEELGGIGLVVIDTLARVMPGGNDSEQRDMGAVIAAAKKIEQTLGCFVLFVHHCGKNAAMGARGHSSLLGATEIEIEITNKVGARCAELTKNRDGETGIKLPFVLKTVDLGPLIDYDPEADPDERITSCVAVPCDESRIGLKKGLAVTGANQTLVLAALRELVSEQGQRLPETPAIPPGSCGVPIDTLVARARQSLLKVNSKRRNERILAALNSLRDGNVVGIAAPWVWLY